MTHSHSQISETDYSWIDNYNGAPYETYNCFTLFQEVQQKIYGVPVENLPHFDPFSSLSVMRAFARANDRSRWVQVDDRQDGYAVIMTKSGVEDHIGIWIRCSPGGMVLHSVAGEGVLLSCVTDIKVVGWRPTFWKFCRKD